MSQSVIVYGLKDDLGIRYVGVTSRSPNTRARELLAAANCETSRLNPAVRAWLLQLREAGKRPRVQVLRIVPAKQAFQHETEFIESFQLQGEPILNSPHEGGVVGHLPQQTKNCEQCGDEFTTRSGKAKYCSGKCQQASWREKWGIVHKGVGQYVKTTG